ncbi:hypothetical protein OJF2_14280 [Aquisphaera giovannonii]|uniref:Peptidase C-terminal archaeal/bacterial domain-containing protein n=1 Tax=Aquisphaera giovannonii TaxID=406548 RepID=A0A5B9VXD9_9BACT|nr:pre-peptidase C-terminal domain-containing protein [Aquisphaera giovannonii]QEH32938.1 hypothetical protein OJF2_14280 [Aquisphaera giovannonii]
MSQHGRRDPGRHDRRDGGAYEGRRRRARRARPAIEDLERRAMLAGDWAESNNSLSSPYVVGFVEGTLTYQNLSIHSSSDKDYFLFQVDGGSNSDDFVRIQFDGDQGDLDLKLYHEYYDPWYGYQFELVGSSSGVGDAETVSLSGLPAGIYAAYVFGYGGATNPSYSLQVAAPGTYDSYQRNDYPWTATDMVTVRDQYTYGRQSIDSRDAAAMGDWYSFNIPRGGVAGNFAAIDFNAAYGDLDLRLYDSDLNLLDQSTGSGNHEQVSFNRLPVGRYYVQVYGYAGATNPDYALTINEAPVRPDAMEPNDSLGGARDLGTLQGTTIKDGLSIHSSTDQDWFKFTTLATSRPGDGVGITFDDAVGDLDLYLYDAGGNLLGSSRGTGKVELVDMGGLPAGTYFARVQGFLGDTNDRYILALQTPRATAAADLLEPNDTRATATALGAVSGRREVANMSIHAGAGGQPNDDWFRFDLAAAAINGHDARIEFDATLGDLDLELYNSAGTMLNRSAGVSGVEQISLAGLAAGTYYLRAYGYGKATNPNYKLIIDAPGGTGSGDLYEPNNTRAAATNLGVARGYVVVGGDEDHRLSIHDGADEDWFKFTTTTAGVAGNDVSIAFDHGLGDLDLELYDSSGNRLVSSAGVGDEERISLQGRAAGTYYARVFGYNRAANPVYSLTLRAPGDDEYDVSPRNDASGNASNLNDTAGNVQGEKVLGHLSIGAGDVDWFKFTTARAGGVNDYVRIDFWNELGDLDLDLFASGDLSTPVRSSAGAGDRERVPLQGLAAGTYYVRVRGASGAVNPDYALTIDAPRIPTADWAEQNDTVSAATDLGTIAGSYEARPLSIEAAGDADWFKFQIIRTGQAPHYAAISFDHADGDLDLALFSSSNTTTPIAVSDGVSDLQSVSLAGLAAGTYYLRVVGYNNATNPHYVLSVDAPARLVADAYEPNDSASAAVDLKALAGVFTRDGLSIHTSTDQDWFKFQIGAGADASSYAAIAFDQSLGDLDLRLYAADGATLLASSATISGVEQVSLQNRSAGTYYLQVVGYNGATNPSYSLTVSVPRAGGDRAEPNNEAASAYDLRQVEGLQAFTDLSIHASTDQDWFRFTTVAAGVGGDYVAIVAPYKLGDLDLELYSSSSSTTPVLTLKGSSKTTDDAETISLAGLPAGTYYVRVVGNRGSTAGSYSLVVQAPRRNVPIDWSEPNNTSSSARDLRTVEGFAAWGGLSIHAGDADWFRFSTTRAGTAEQFVAIAFDASLGDLTLELYALSNLATPLAKSAGTGNVELISLAGLAAGAYYVRVVGASTTVANPNYVLGINAPVMPVRDFAEPNNSLATAYDLRQASGSLMLGGLSIDSSTDQDWFKVQTLSTGLPGDVVRIDAAYADGNLELALYNSAGTLLATSASSADYEQISLQGRPAGIYYIRVMGTAGAVAADYTLSINASQAAGRIQPDFAESNNTRATAYDLRQGMATSSSSRKGGLGGVDGFIGTLYSSVVVPDYGTQTWSSGNAAFDAGVAGFREAYRDQMAQQTIRNLPSILSSVNNQVVSAVMGYVPSLGTSILESAGFTVQPKSYEQLLLEQYQQMQRQQYQAQLAALAEQRYQQESQQAMAQSGIVTSNIIGSALGNLQGAASSVLGSLNLGGAGTSAPIYNSAGYTSPFLGSVYNSPSAAYGGYGAYGMAPAYVFVPSGMWGAGRSYDAAPMAITGLSVHSSSDQDWFKFELTSTGRDGQYVGISFDDSLGDLTMELYDAAGTLVEKTAGAGGLEKIGLERLAAGAYYVLVRGAANPSYTLLTNITPAATLTPDWSEPDESTSAARDLRRLEGATTIRGLSISSASDNDYFTFSTASAGVAGHSIRLAFDRTLGDLDLQLFSSTGALLATSAGVGDSEEISMAGRAAGTYYVRVYGYAGATNPSYSLTFDLPRVTAIPDGLEPNDSIATAADLTNASSTNHLTGLTITPAAGGRAADVDYFKFTTTGAGTAAHAVSLRFDEAAGAVEVSLVNASGQVLRAATAGTGLRRIPLEGLAAGTYYLKVAGKTTAVSNSYSLDLDAPMAPSGARDSWTILVYMSVGDLEDEAARNVNEMELAASFLPADVHIAVLYDQSAAGKKFATGAGAQAAWGDTGRAIIRGDLDRDVIGTTFDRTIGEQNTGTSAALVSFITWATQVAPADRYALVLWDHGNGFRGFNRDNLDNAGSDNLTTAELASALSSTSAFFRPSVLAFDECLMAMAEVGYSLRTYADAIVGSEENEGPEGQDYASVLSALATRPRLVAADQLASAFVQSYQDRYRGDRGGADTQSAVRTAGYADLANALKAFVNAALAAGTAADWDLIRQAGAAASSFGINPSGDPGYRDLKQFAAWIGANAGITASIRTAANAVASAVTSLMYAVAIDGRTTGGQSIYLPAVGTAIDSTYASQYASFLTATSTATTAPDGWLSFLRKYVQGTAAQGTLLDWAESNNVAARAFDLGFLAGPGQNFSNLNIHQASDLDYFRFAIGAAGAATSRVVASSAGVKLSLYNGQGALLATSSPVGGLPTISLSGRGAGGYRLRVEPAAAGTTVASYSLTIDAPAAPAIPADWAPGNDTRAKAFDLGVVNGETVFAGLTLPSSTSVDWFRFTTPRIDASVASGTNKIHVKTTAGQRLTAQLVSSSGSVLQAVTGAGDLVLTYAIGDAVSYSLSVTGAAGSYSIHFERTGSAGRGMWDGPAPAGVQSLEAPAPAKTIPGPSPFSGKAIPGFAGRASSPRLSTRERGVAASARLMPSFVASADRPFVLTPGDLAAEQHVATPPHRRRKR